VAHSTNPHHGRKTIEKLILSEAVVQCLGTPLWPPKVVTC